MTRRIYPLLLIALVALPVHAQDAPPVPRTQRQTFALAYTLRSGDLHAQAFVRSVKALQSINDDRMAGAVVANLSRRGAALRRSQADRYGRIARLLEQLAAPQSLRDWAAQTAASLSAPLVYSGDAKALIPTEPDTAAALAEISEVQTVKAKSDTHRPALSLWLKVTGGSLALWTAEVGTCAADLSAAGQSPDPDFLPFGTARRLLETAPPEAPSEVRGDLSELTPRGGGNLQEMATIAPAVTPEKMRMVSGKLRDAYQARKLTEMPDKAE